MSNSSVYIDDAESLTCVAEALVKCADKHEGSDRKTLLQCASMLLTDRMRQIDRLMPVEQTAAAALLASYQPGTAYGEVTA